jgi:hypothetical protein
MHEPQLLLRSKTRYYSRGSIIADSREDASGLLVITAGQVTTTCLFVKTHSMNVTIPTMYGRKHHDI